MNKVDRQRDIKPHSKMENPEKKKITRQEKKNDMDVDNNDVLMGLNHMRIESNRNLMQNLYTNRSSTESSNLSDLPTDINYMYIERENNVLINNYGPDIYNFSKELESFEVPSNYLARHKIDSNVRTKMVDWIIEVLYAYSCDVPTFFLAVHLLDSYVYQSKTTLSINEFHLSGICCIYLASKMEDIIPLRMSHIKAKIGHNKFSEKEIKKREKMILTDIKFDVITTSTYDFINTFILDFKLNNKELIKRLDMNKHIDALSNVCIFLAKLMTLHDEFTPHK